MIMSGIDVQPGTRLEVVYIYDSDDPRSNTVVNAAVFDGSRWVPIASDRLDWLEPARHEETGQLIGIDDPWYGFWQTRENSRGSVCRSRLISPVGEPIEMRSWYASGS